MVADSKRKVARKLLGKDERHEVPMTARRPGKVIGVDTDGTATVTIGGDPEPVPGIASDSEYVPAFGDDVWLDITDGDVYITGAQGTSPTGARLVQWARVATGVARAATTYGDLTASVGPSVTVMVGDSGQLEVVITCGISTSSNDDGGAVGVALSGANTVAATDDKALIFYPLVNGAGGSWSRTVFFGGLTPGLTTCTLKYKDVADAGADVTYSGREILARPL